MAEAAASGRRLTAAELAGYGRSGEQAALAGVALRGLVDLYLSATWRLWRELPAGTSLAAVRAAGLAVLRAADDAVAAAAEGFERALPDRGPPGGGRAPGVLRRPALRTGRRG